MKHRTHTKCIGDHLKTEIKPSRNIHKAYTKPTNIQAQIPRTHKVYKKYTTNIQQAYSKHTYKPASKRKSYINKKHTKYKHHTKHAKL